MNSLDWSGPRRTLSESGFAPIPGLVSPRECADVLAMYDHEELFRTRIEMARYRFGKGEYKYFRYPLPPLVEELRQTLYPGLAEVANEWEELLGSGRRFPGTLSGLIEECHAAGQRRPTPLVLRYHAGDYNCLHQDIYGTIAFPFQVVVFLSEPGCDYRGGEFLLVESAPRAQSMGRAFLPRRGDAMVIPTRHRPVRGKRSVYRAALRHGVSPVTEGERWTLGIIFHDSE